MDYEADNFQTALDPTGKGRESTITGYLWMGF